MIARQIKIGLSTSLFMLFMTSCAPSVSYHPVINDPLVVNTSGNDQISIMTYNIQSIFGKNESKLNALADYINKEHYDFVLFQELFDEAVRDQILSKIDRNIFQSIVSRVDYTSFPEMLFQDSGLFLTSRYPQVDLSGIKFDDEVNVSEGAIHMILDKEISVSTDFLANKSVMGSLHQLNESTYLFIFTTHVQALGSVSHKRRQYRQIREFIEYAAYAVLKAGIVESSYNMVVILTGDFNSDAYNNKKVTTLIADLGSPRDLYQESNPSKQAYTMIFRLLNMYKRFDYIFAYDQIGSFPLKKVMIRSINVTDLKTAENESISDHLAIKAAICFDNTNNYHQTIHSENRIKNEN